MRRAAAPTPDATEGQGQLHRAERRAADGEPVAHLGHDVDRQLRAEVALLAADRRFAATARRPHVGAGDAAWVGDRRAAGAAPRVELGPVAEARGALALNRDVPGHVLVRQRGLERRVAVRRAVVVAAGGHLPRAALAAVVAALREPEALPARARPAGVVVAARRAVLCLRTTQSGIHLRRWALWLVGQTLTQLRGSTALWLLRGTGNVSPPWASARSGPSANIIELRIIELRLFL